jgi:hypothetical protein
MTDRLNEGLWAWKQRENNNRMITLQAVMPDTRAVRLAYFGGSAFRITAPSGLTLMIDPWRNRPLGNLELVSVRLSGGGGRSRAFDPCAFRP